MDPYLEDPALWRGVHHRLISAISDLLQPQLVPRGYFVDIESRVWIEEVDRPIYPDLGIITRPLPLGQDPPAGVLVADEPVRIRGLAEEISEDFLQIRELAGGRLVAGIEIISPSNKSDSEARTLYIRKRREMAEGGAHLIEVDLLRAGRPLVQVPPIVLNEIQPGRYIINVRRANSPDHEYYPIDLRTRLPRVGIPLKPNEPDAVADLQAALTSVYQAGAYGSRIDYTKPPTPPLAPVDASWAHELLVQAGLRPANP
jgi:hypothetical protein